MRDKLRGKVYLPSLFSFYLLPFFFSCLLLCFYLIKSFFTPFLSSFVLFSPIFLPSLYYPFFSFSPSLPSVLFSVALRSVRLLALVSPAGAVRVHASRCSMAGCVMFKNYIYACRCWCRYRWCVHSIIIIIIIIIIIYIF